MRFYDRRQFIAGTVAALLIGGLTASLGTWQLRRADERIAAQQRQDAALAQPPIDLGRAAAGDQVLEGRLTLTGRFDAARTIFLDNRTREGIAGFHVLAPMQLQPSGQWVLVLRGWLARDARDRMRIPELQTPPADVTIEGVGIARLEQPMLLARSPEPGPADRIWQHVDYPLYERWSGLTLRPMIVRQNAEPALADGLARDWIQPGNNVDRHHGYAFQWFAMTTVTVLAWCLLLWRQLRRRPTADSPPPDPT